MGLDSKGCLQTLSEKTDKMHANYLVAYILGNEIKRSINLKAELLHLSPRVN